MNRLTIDTFGLTNKRTGYELAAVRLGGDNNETFFRHDAPPTDPQAMLREVLSMSVDDDNSRGMFEYHVLEQGDGIEVLGVRIPNEEARRIVAEYI